MVRQDKSLNRLVVTAVLLALGMVLPFLTGQIPTVGQLISPLHIPVFICALTCGWGWAGALGVVLPLLRSVVFGMPPLVAVGIPMAAEMAVYGVVTGLMYRLVRGKMPKVAGMLVAMMIAMVAGRLVGGGVKALVMGLQGAGYSWAAFVAAYFTGTVVGAVIHLILCPIVALALEKAKVSPGA